MPDIKAVTLLAGTGHGLAQQVEEALEGVPAEHVISVSYAVSRLFGITLQHHALVVVKPMY